jgi:hypothetical protein
MNHFFLYPSCFTAFQLLEHKIKNLLVGFVLLLSCSVLAAENIIRQSGKLNSVLSFDSFTFLHKNCYYAISIQHSTKKPSSMSIVAARDEDPTYKGIIRAGFRTCDVTVEDYKYAVNLLWPEVKKEIKSPIAELSLGMYKKSSMLKNFPHDLALASVKDPDFLKIRKEGKIKFTIGGIFNKLAINNHLFDEFIKVHQDIGINLSYSGVEKVFRGKVETSQFKEELLSKGFHPKDQLLTNAGIVYFAIKNL